MALDEGLAGEPVRLTIESGRDGVRTRKIFRSFAMYSVPAVECVWVPTKGLLEAFFLRVFAFHHSAQGRWRDSNPHDLAITEF